jgi:hypothetical protein
MDRTEAPSGQPGALVGRLVAPRGRESVLELPLLEDGDTGSYGLITSIVAAAWKSAATTSSFEGVDEDRRRTAGRRKSILDRKRKTSADEPWGTILGAPSTAPSPLPYLLPPDGGKNQSGRGEAIPPEGGTLARPRCWSHAQVGRT